MSLALSEGSVRPALVATVALLGIALLGVTVGGYWLSVRNARFALAIAMTGGDPSAGPRLMRTFGCAGCHTISGVPGADGKVGPRLEHLRGRVFIAGGLPNTPDNLVNWIANPQSFAPHSAMPATGISEAQARDIAAFLYSR